MRGTGARLNGLNALISGSLSVFFDQSEACVTIRQDRVDVGLGGIDLLMSPYHVFALHCPVTRIDGTPV